MTVKGTQNMDIKPVFTDLVVDGVAVIETSGNIFLGTREFFGVAWKVTNPNPSALCHIKISYQTSCTGQADHWTTETAVIADETTEDYKESSVTMSPTKYIRFIIEGVTGNPTSGGITLSLWFIAQD